MSDQDLDLAKQVAALTAERDALRARVTELAPRWRTLHTVDVEVLTLSEANQREHPMARAKRVKIQHEAVALALWRDVGRLEGPRLLAQEGRLLVCMTRQGARLLDTDNLAGALKGCRDAIAQWLGCDDGAKAPVRWHTEQEAHKRWRLRPRVRIDLMGVEQEAGGQLVLGGGR